MIQWKLKQVMQSYGIRRDYLAEELGVSCATISAWRSAKTTPTMSGKRKSQLLMALNKLRSVQSRPIDLCDLEVWVDD